MDVRKTADAMRYALCSAHNTDQLAKVSTTYFHLRARTLTSAADHRAPTESALLITTANSSDLATSVALTNVCFDYANLHFADSVAHNSAVSAQLTTALATDLTTAQTRANAIKAAYNTHRTAGSVHYNNDAVNAIAAADATDQGSLNTLINEIKADLNIHTQNAPPGTYLNLVDV
jgi:hypothetical protein